KSTTAITLGSLSVATNQDHAGTPFSTCSLCKLDIGRSPFRQLPYLSRPASKGSSLGLPRGRNHDGDGVAIATFRFYDYPEVLSVTLSTARPRREAAGPEGHLE